MSRRRSLLVAAAVALTVGATTALPAAASAARLTSPEARQTYLVTYRSAADGRAVAADIARSGARVRHAYQHALDGAALSLNASELAMLRSDPRVTLIEADAPVSLTAEQSSAPWGLDRSDQRLRPLSGTYTYNTAGAGVTAYIVDTGIRADHTDFGGRVSTNGYTAINDGNGKNDCNGHGTHVSGTVAGTTYGMAKSATLVPVRVLGCDGGGSWSGVIAGLDWIVSDHVSGPAVANMSLGGGASSTVDAAVGRVVADGVTVVVAAGNANRNACNYSPARAAAAITVGATTSSDARASYSNFGSCLDIFAPGSAVTSAWYTSTTATASLNGTSMASPHVAGAAALLLGVDGSLSPSTVTSQLTGNATTGVVGSAGTGSPNRLLYVDPTAGTTGGGGGGGTEPPATNVPSTPTNVTAVAGRGSATVSWTITSDGGSAITGQVVYVYQSGGSFVGTVSVAGTARSVTIKLSRFVSYYFTVDATNSAGTSLVSAPSNTIRTT